MSDKLKRVTPQGKYCGVVFELEFPSRFDKTELCSGSAAYVLKDAFGGGLSRYNCELRTLACEEAYPQGTKVVLLCGERGLAKIGRVPAQLNALRGSPFLMGNIVYIPTFHPQQCADRANYEGAFNPAAHLDDAAERDDGDESVKDMGRTARRNYRFWFIQDVRKALRVAREGYHPNSCTYCTNLSSDGIITALRRTTASTPLYLDIETSIQTGQMICFGWSNGADRVYVAPILTYGGGLAFPEPTIRVILRELALAMGCASVVVCHNALFDLFILAWRYRILPPAQSRCYDTMVAHARAHVDTEKSLGHCTSLYTQQPYHKDEGNFNPSNYTQWQQLLTYNAKDVETTALVHAAQLDAQRADKGLAASVAQGNNLIRPLLLKSLRGLLIDKDALCKRIDQLSKRLTWVEGKLLAPLAGGSVNPRSPKQVAELLYNKLLLPKSTDPTVSVTGKDALYRLALKFPVPVLKVLLHCRALSKERGTLGATLWRESHITCAYVITGTKTFRLSSRALLGTWGTNLQNWSKPMRGLVVAAPGHSLVQVDQSGAEALIVAYLAPPGRYRDLFIERVSPHVYFGLFAFPEVWKAELGYDISYLWPLSIAQCKADRRWSEIARCIKASDNNPPARRYYYFQKQINHSSNYDIKANRFAANLLEKSEGQVHLPVHECDRLLKVYHGLYPEIREGFQAYVKGELYKNRLLRNLFGYPRKFYGWVEGDESILKDAYSWIPQSTVGCITGIADSSLQSRIDSGELSGFSVLQNNHDSLLCQCKDGDEAITARFVCAAMNVEMVSPRGERFAMRSEASIGKDWYHMTEIKL